MTNVVENGSQPPSEDNNDIPHRQQHLHLLQTRTRYIRSPVRSVVLPPFRDQSDWRNQRHLLPATSNRCTPSQTTTTTYTGPLLGRYAIFIERFIKRKLDPGIIGAGIEMDKVRELNNGPRVVADDYAGDGGDEGEGGWSRGERGWGIGGWGWNEGERG